jgi:NhaP-type Na+/H+ or K+/H+ antiporter
LAHFSRAREQNIDTGTIGMLVGLIIRVTPGRSIQDSVSFDYQFFFNLLLPPIILASGYELHQVWA